MRALSRSRLVALNTRTPPPSCCLLFVLLPLLPQELLLLFDSDHSGLTFGGFLDLYRMEDMDLATDCFTQRLTHGRNIKDIPTLLPSMSLLPSTDAKR